MLLECLINVYQRKSSMENYVDKRSRGGQKKRYRDITKPGSKTSTYQQSRGYRIEQSGSASLEGVLVNSKQKESAKPNGNMLSGKPELRHHQQSFLPQTSLVLRTSPTGSLKLRSVSSAILEHTNSSTSCI